MKEQITLDECIKYFEADAAENKKLYLIYKTYDEDMATMHKEDAERSTMVATWLKCLNEIWAAGDCNDCEFRGTCEIKPRLGQLVRFNCFLYRKGVR